MQDMMPQDNMNPAHDGGHDREGAMAKADLYKLANYSLKLFKQIQDNDQLEAWVQAKITKAADYVASVYHYLEYEMKFSEYGERLDSAEMYSEDQKVALKNKLMEAKATLKALKIAQVEKVSEGVLSGGDRPCSECGGTGMVYEQPKAVPAHVKDKVEKYNRQAKAMHAASKRIDKNKNGIPDDEEFGESSEDRKPAKVKSRDTTLPSGAKVKSHTVQGWQSQKADKEANKERKKNDEVSESEDRPASKKKETTWTDKSGKKHPSTVVQGSKSVAADKEANKERKKLDKDLDESSHQAKTTMKHVNASNASDKEKSAINKASKDIKPGIKGYKDREDALKAAGVKDDRGPMDEGKDEGKPGKNFAKIAKSAGKAYGSKEAGERVAGAVRAKLAKQGKLEEAKPDFLDMDKDGDKKEPMKKAVADKKKNPFAKKVKEGSIQGGVWTSAPPKKGEKDVPAPSGDPEGVPAKPAAKKAPVKKAEADATTAVAESVLAESAEVARLKELTQKLLG